MSEKVWYASYGSNILWDRFKMYLDDIKKDYGIKVEIYDQRAFVFNHPIFFAKSSSKWENKGVSFLDTTREGQSFGWMYLIDKDNLQYIKEKEGPTWYGNEYFCGTDEKGNKIYTLTCKENSNYQNNDPGMNYINVIAKGLYKRYGFDIYFLNDYLGFYFKFIKEFNLSDEHIKEILDEIRAR